MAATLLLLFVSLSITANHFNNALANDTPVAVPSAADSPTAVPSTIDFPTTKPVAVDPSAASYPAANPSHDSNDTPVAVPSAADSPTAVPSTIDFPTTKPVAVDPSAASYTVANPSHDSNEYECPPARCRESGKATFLIVFGDSLFDVGFGTAELCLPSKYPPYGQKLKSGPTGRFSDGRTIPDFIAEYVLGAADREVSPYTCNLTKATIRFTGRSLSFAKAGAGVLEGISKGTGRTLKDQVELFAEVDDKIKLVGEDSKRREETLYLISIGAFDYLREIKKETPTPIDPTEVVKKIVDAVRTIDAVKGGRRFAFLNIGPLRYYPAVQKLNLGEEKLCVLDSLVKRHNEELKQRLSEALKDSTYSYSILDYHSIIKNIMEKPGSYGFDTHTIKSACCGWGPFKAEGCGTLDKVGCGEHSIEEYVFFDGIHHTAHINHHLAKIFWNSNEFASPTNLKSIAGLEKTEFDFPRF